MIDHAVFSVALAGASLALGIAIGQQERPECAPTVDGRRLTVVYADGSCRYEAEPREISPTELRRMANARERMARTR